MNAMHIEKQNDIKSYALYFFLYCPLGVLSPLIGQYLSSWERHLRFSQESFGEKSLQILKKNEKSLLFYFLELRHLLF